MWALMIICDIVTTLIVYYIGLKLYSEQTAFIAAMLSASALSSAYFIIIGFDAFPTCFAMVAILATIYGDKITGYWQQFSDYSLNFGQCSYSHSYAYIIRKIHLS